MNNLKAYFTLDLRDNLSAGIGRLKEQFEQLRQLGRQLSLGKLGEATGTLRAIGHEVAEVTRGLHSMGAVANRAWARIKQMASGPIGKVKHAFGEEGKLGALGAAVQGVSVIAPVRTYADIQGLALRSAITEGLSGAAANRQANQLVSLFQREALKTGQSPTSVAETFIDLLQTGLSARQAKELLPIHSRVATAYGIDASVLTPATFALSSTLQIPAKQMAAALSGMALAAQKGRFKMEDFARAMPGLAADMATFGIKGRRAAAFLEAALETVAKTASEPGVAATNLSEILRYITSKSGMRAFALEGRGMSPVQKQLLARYHITGINLPAVLRDARLTGKNPLEAVMSVLQAKLHNLPPDVVKEVLGAFFGNAQALSAAQAMLLYSADYASLKQKILGVSANKTDTDFHTAMQGGNAQTKQFAVAMTVLGEELGEGFLPILLGINRALRAFFDALDFIDVKLPGVKNAVLLVVGAMLTLGTVISAIGFVMPAFTAGWNLLVGAFQLLLMPLRWIWMGLNFIVDGIAGVLGVSGGLVVAILAVAAVFAAAAYDIYENWGKFAGFFRQMGRGLINIFSGLTDFLVDVFTLNFTGAAKDAERIWHGFGQFFGGLIGTVKKLFLDLIHTLDGWTGGAVTAVFNKMEGAVGAVVAKFQSFKNLIENGAIARFLGLAQVPQLQAPGGRHGSNAAEGPASGPDLSGARYLMPQQAPVTGHITVGVDPRNNTVRVQQTKSSSPRLSMLPDMGLALGVP